MPDAVWVSNLFGRNSQSKKVAVVNWETHVMHINLKDLGEGFNIEAINEGNEFISEVNNDTFQIRPGTYIVSKKGIQKKWSETDDFKANKLYDFYAPESNVDQLYFLHEPAKVISENNELVIEVQCIDSEIPEELMLTGSNNGVYFNVKFDYFGNYKYKAIIDPKFLKNGFLNYNIIVKQKDGHEMTFPAGKEGNLYAWDFYDRTPYKVAIVSNESPVNLFNAIEDTDNLVRPWKRSFKLIPTENVDEAECQMNIEQLFVPDQENLNANPIYDYSFKHFIMDKVKSRSGDLDSKETLVFRGRALNNKPCKLQIAFVLKDGSAYGKVMELGTVTHDYILNLDDLKPVKTVTLPRPYPSFLPYYLHHEMVSDFDINKVESLQFSIGPEIPENEITDSHGIAIISVSLK
jgi:hypothetical protein